MKVALVITVKNEERLLRTNLIYHLGIGISNIFVYFDNSTDNGRKSILDLKGVFTFDSINADIYKHHKYLDKFTSQAEVMHTARQCLNTFDAIQRCKESKIDWLLSLDADELFLTSNVNQINLKAFFERCKHSDVVQLSTMEVVGRQIEYDNVMAQETLFKSQSRFKYWNDRVYFDFYDPYSKETITHPAWLGHTMGKCAVNVNSGLIPKNVHRFVSIEKRPLKTVTSGFVLHYSLYDFKDFKKKFHNIQHRPDVFLNGKSLPRLPLVWRNMVNDPNFTDDFLKEYYHSNLYVNDKKQKKFYSTRFFNIFNRREPAVVNVDYPSKILNAIDL